MVQWPRRRIAICRSTMVGGDQQTRPKVIHVGAEEGLVLLVLTGPRYSSFSLQRRWSITSTELALDAYYVILGVRRTHKCRRNKGSCFEFWDLMANHANHLPFGVRILYVSTSYVKSLQSREKTRVPWQSIGF